MQDKKNFYINGKWVSPKNPKEINVIDPATEKSCAVISLGSKDDVDLAVKAAKEAFKTWGFTSKEERIKYLENLYTLYKKRWADIANAITIEMGAPKDFSTKLQTGTGASHIKSFIRYLKEFEFERVLGDHAQDQKILYEPKGNINYSVELTYEQVCLKLFQHLHQDVYILKPSEIAPLSSIILAEIIDEAKFPQEQFSQRRELLQVMRLQVILM